MKIKYKRILIIVGIGIPVIMWVGVGKKLYERHAFNVVGEIINEIHINDEIDSVRGKMVKVPWICDVTEKSKLDRQEIKIGLHGSFIYCNWKIVTKNSRVIEIEKLQN